MGFHKLARGSEPHTEVLGLGYEESSGTLCQMLIPGAQAVASTIKQA